MVGYSKVSLSLLCLMASSIMTPCTRAQNTPQDFLDPHNKARNQVGVGPLVWDDVIADYAQNYSNQRKADCKLQHSGGPYGENLFWGSGSKYTAADAVKSWVDEKQWYDYDSNSCASGKVCGHYTQVVWNNSVELGCATVTCDNGGTFIICNYNPPGNYPGQLPY